MTEVLINRKLGRNLGFCEGGIAEFISRSGITLGRKGITADQFAQGWRELPAHEQHGLVKEYAPYLDKVAMVLGTTLEAWLGVEEQPFVFEGIRLGKPVGKRNYVSGTTAYEQDYEGGTMCISYTTPVGFKRFGENYRTIRRYSVTTSKHMGRFRLYSSHPVTEGELRRLWSTASYH